MLRVAENRDRLRWQTRIESVLATRREARDVISIELPLKLSERPLPGQFQMLYAFGKGESPISFSRILDDRIVHTIRELGPVTRALGALQAGDELALRGPFGNHWPLPWQGEAARPEQRKPAIRDVIVMAGGLGLAPLRPVLDSLHEHRKSLGRVLLLVGARDPGSLLFLEDLKAWSKVFDVRCTVDHATRQSEHPSWRGSVGFVHSLLDRSEGFSEATAAYLCGPEIMMRTGANRLLELGVPASSISVSLERSMKCAVGLCGHCQLGTRLLCQKGPVCSYSDVRAQLSCREL